MNHHHDRKNNPELIRCHTKRAFASKQDAEKSGQRAYLCPVCHFWHRTGGVRTIWNPVLKILLTALIISLTSQVQGEIIADKSPAEVRYAIIQNMVKRGYKVFALRTSAIYFVYPGATYDGVVKRCDEQRFMFTLREQGDKTAITGFAVCYTGGNNIPYGSFQIDSIIVDAIKNIPLKFP